MDTDDKKFIDEGSLSSNGGDNPAGDSAYTPDDENNDGANAGKSLKTTFAEYINSKKTTRQVSAPKPGKSIEFTHPPFEPYEEEQDAAAFEAAPEAKKEEEIGGFVNVSGPNAAAQDARVQDSRVQDAGAQDAGAQKKSAFDETINYKKVKAKKKGKAGRAKAAAGKTEAGADLSVSGKQKDGTDKHGFLGLFAGQGNKAAGGGRQDSTSKPDGNQKDPDNNQKGPAITPKASQRAAFDREKAVSGAFGEEADKPEISDSGGGLPAIRENSGGSEEGDNRADSGGYEEAESRGGLSVYEGAEIRSEPGGYENGGGRGGPDGYDVSGGRGGPGDYDGRDNRGGLIVYENAEIRSEPGGYENGGVQGGRGGPGDYDGHDNRGGLIVYEGTEIWSEPGGYEEGGGRGGPDGYGESGGRGRPGDYADSVEQEDSGDYDDGGSQDDRGDYEEDDDAQTGYRRRKWTPGRVIRGFFLFLYISVKWVLIYMGRFIATVFKTATVIMLVIGFGVLGAGVGAIYGYLRDVEPITSIMLEMKIQSSYIYDADGNQIARLTGSSNINRQLVRYNDISPHLPKALIAIEDKRFESHNGVDPRRIVSAGLRFALGGSDTHGASTITQQLVKNVTGKKDETLERKVQEWYLAIELEKTMEKWKILELYLNAVYFGNGCYGVSSASKTYFGKPVSDLTLAESAFLIGITNSPGRYNPFSETGFKNALKRQGVILDEMLKQGRISDEEYSDAMEETVRIIPKAIVAAVASKPNSYFVDCVIEEVKNDLMREKGITSEMAFAQIYNYGLRIYTTQSPAIQTSLDSVFSDPAFFPAVNPDAVKNNETPQGAMVILEPGTARILAMAGGYGEKLGDRTFNRATQARRQPGSSIKPVAVYGPALDQNVISLATPVDDAPTHLDPNDTERIYPSNSSNDFRGITTVRNAIRRSVNVVAAKTWLRIPDTSLIYLDKAGINRLTEKHVALALGGMHKGVTPLEMAAAYVPFVNRGMYYEPTTYTKVLDSSGRILLDKTARMPTIVYSEQTAFLMTSALEDVVKSGTGTAAALFDGKMPAAGKTGTTNDNADRWFVGYTPYYVASTWYGYDNKIKKITLAPEELSNAIYIWNAVMEKIHVNLEPKNFTVPDYITYASVCAYSGKAPTALCASDPRGNAVISEYFAKGTEPHESDPCTVHVSSSICRTASEAIGRTVAAGPNCPSGGISSRVSVRREVPFTPEEGDPYPSDWSFEYSSLPRCPYHTAGGIAAEYAPEPEPTAEPGAGEDPASQESSPPGDPGAQGQGEAGNSASEPTRPIRTPRPSKNINPAAPGRQTQNTGTSEPDNTDG